MEENLSWRARLAKANINILNITLMKTDYGIINRWFVEFTYHPKPGTFKWCKTYIDILPEIEYDEDMAQMIMDKVLAIRKELEG